MILQSKLDLSTFEIIRFRIWNQTSNPDDYGIGTKYFNTNSGHDGYNRENIYTETGWRKTAYLDDIDKVNEKLDLIFGDEIDTDTIIDSWKEVQDFLSGIEDTKTLMTMLDDKLSISKGGTITGNLTVKTTSWGAQLKVDGDNTQAGIGFYHDGTNIGYLVTYAPNKLAWYDSVSMVAHTLIHAGNALDQLKGTFLPLTGGTISGTGVNPLNINTTNESEVGLYFNQNNTSKAWVGYAASGGAGIYDVATKSTLGITIEGVPHFNKKTLLHEGNVGDFALKTDGSNGMSYGANISWGDENKGQEDYEGYSTGFRLLHYNTSSRDYRGGIHVGARYGWQLVREANTERMYVRYIDPNAKTWSDWKTIAFTDSDITGNAATATKLQDNTAFTAWGQTFFENGKPKTVSGDITMNNYTAIKFKNAAGTGALNVMMVDSNNCLTIGYDLATNSVLTRIDGSQIFLRYGSAHTNGLILNSYGNVTIGGSDLASDTYGLYVSKSLPSYFSNRVLIGGAEDDGTSALQVNGHTVIKNNFDYNAFDTSGNKVSLLGLTSQDKVVFGIGAYYYQLPSALYGKTIELKSGSNVLAASFDAKGLSTFHLGALIPTGQKLTIGSVTFEEDADGRVKVDGDMYTTGTLASGGKAKEGTGTGSGSANVRDFELPADGKTTYDCDHLLKSKNVIVQVFEKAIQGNIEVWEMILTDVMIVTEDRVTVTFGRPTTKVHKVHIIGGNVS